MPNVSESLERLPFVKGVVSLDEWYDPRIETLYLHTKASLHVHALPKVEDERHTTSMSGSSLKWNSVSPLAEI